MEVPNRRVALVAALIALGAVAAALTVAAQNALQASHTPAINFTITLENNSMFTLTQQNADNMSLADMSRKAVQIALSNKEVKRLLGGEYEVITTVLHIKSSMKKSGNKLLLTGKIAGVTLLLKSHGKCYNTYVDLETGNVDTLETTCPP